jgi:hypothetical protein
MLRAFMVERGFVSYKSRAFVRRSGDMLHYFGLQPHKFDPTFVVVFAALSLFPPRDAIVLTVGDRLYGRDGRWWPAETDGLVDFSVQEIVSCYEGAVQRFWDGTADLKAYSDQLRSERLDANRRFDLAACQARVGDPWALRNAAAAVGEYQVWLAENPARSWCSKSILWAEELCKALQDGNEQQLLNSWIEKSVAQLKLPSHA